jgi:hypothetical protein
LLILPPIANVPVGIFPARPRNATEYLKKDLLPIMPSSYKTFVRLSKDIPFSITNVVLSIDLLFKEEKITNAKKHRTNTLTKRD